MANDIQTIFQILIDVLGKEKVDQLSESVGGAGKAGTKASPELQAFIDKLQDLADRSELVSKALDLQSKLEANNDALAAAKKALADLNAEFTRTDKSSVEISTAFAQAQKQVNALAAEQLKLQNASAATSDQLRAAGIDSTKLGEAQADLRAKTKVVGDEMLKAASAAKESGSAFDRVKELAKGAGESFKAGAEHVIEFGKRLTEITGIAGLVASALGAIKGFEFIAKGVEEARDGEVALAKLKASVDGNAESFEHLKEVAEQAAESVGTTSNDAVETLTKLTAAFGSADAAAKALPATLTLAKAAQIDFAESADLVSTTLKAFNLNADQAGQVADKLAAIAARTGVNLAELAKGAAQVAPLAKDAAVGFDGVAAALAELSAKGFDAQKSNAGLRELFIALQDSTNKFRQAIVDAGGDTSNFGSILDALRNSSDHGSQALEGLSAKGRAAIAALVQGGGAGLQQFQQVLDQSAGAANRTAKLLGDTLDGALKGFGRTVDTLAEDMVKESLPAVENEIKKLNEELKDVGKSDTFKTLKDSVKDFVAAGVNAFDEFVHSVDWKSLGQTIKEWGTSAGNTIKAVGENASALGRVFGGIADVVSVMWNVVKTVFSSIEMLTSSVMAGVNQSIGITLRLLGTVNEAAKAQAEEYFALAAQYAENAKQQEQDANASRDRVIASLGSLTDRILSSGDAAAAAKAKHEEHAKALKETGDAAKEAEDGIARLPTVIVSVSEEVAVAAEKHKALIDNLAAAKKELLNSLDAYDKLRGTVGATAEQLAAAKQRSQDAAIAYSEAEKAAGNLSLTLGQKANPALIGLNNSIEEGSAKFKDIEGSADALGIKLQGDLAVALKKAADNFENIKNSADDSVAGQTNVANAFVAMAQRQTAAAAQMDDATKHQVATNLAALESTANLTDAQKAQVDALIASIGLQTQFAQTTQFAAQEMDEAARAAERYKKALDKLRNGTGGLDDVKTAMDNAANSTQKAAAAAEGVETKMRAAMGAGQSLAQVMANTAAQFSAVSEAAGNEFNAAMELAMRNIGLTKIAMTDLSHSLGALDASAADLAGFTSYFRALAAVQQETQAKIDAQRESLESEIGLFNSVGTAAQSAFAGAGESADQLLEKLQAQKSALDAGNSGYDLLGNQELAPLQQALDGAIQRTQQLVDAANAAKDAYEALSEQLQDQADQDAGNQEAVEDRRYKKQLEDLEAAAKAAKELGSAQYQQDLANAEAIHRKNMADIAAEAAAKKSSSSSSSTSSAAGSSASSGSPTSSSSSTNTSSSTSGAVTQKIEITINGSDLSGYDENDPRLQRLVGNVVMKVFQDAKRSAGF